MTREEMLYAMGISRDEFVDFLVKYQLFRASLDPAQGRIVDNAMPTLSEVAASFGPDCSLDDVQDMLELIPARPGVVAICWMGCGLGLENSDEGQGG